jgi:hypothetical protein
VGGGVGGADLDTTFIIRRNGTTSIRLQNGLETTGTVLNPSPNFSWNETFQYNRFGVEPETKTIAATVQIDVLRLPGGFPRGVRLSAQWQTDHTINWGPRPGITTTNNGVYFIELLIDNLVPCGSSAASAFVPPPVPPPDPSMLLENYEAPPISLQMQEILDQQARGGGCRGCGDGNNF